MSELTMYDRLRGKEETQESAPETTGQTTEQNIQQTEEASTEQQTTEQEIAETQTTEQTESSQESIYDVEGFNKHFNRSYKDEEELKGLFELPEKVKTFEEQVASRDKTFQELQEKHNSLLDSIDPEKHFPNKEALAQMQLKEKYPNAGVGIISSVREKDVNSMDKLEALVLIDKLTVPSTVSDSVRESEILRGLGIESDQSELTEIDRFRIEREYVSKSNVLNEIKDFQPEINKYDFEGERSQRQEKITQDKAALKTHNEKALKILFDVFKETKSSFQEDGKDYSYTYVVDQKWKDENFTQILDAFTDMGFNINTETKQQAFNQLNNEYFLQNKDAVIRDAVKQEIAKAKEAAHNTIHSDSPTNKNEAPVSTPGEVKTVLESIKSGDFKKRMKNY